MSSGGGDRLAPSVSQQVPQGERATRGRGSYRSEELDTRPKLPLDVIRVTGPDPDSTNIEVTANYVRVDSIKGVRTHSYRVDYEPDVESVPMRRRLFYNTFHDIFSKMDLFDGMSELRSPKTMPESSLTREVPHPADPSRKINVTVKHIKEKTVSPYEMLRLYNLHMLKMLNVLGYHRVLERGGCIKLDLTIPVGTAQDIHMIRGFRTAAGVHMDDVVMMNLEPVHKFMQMRNMLDLFYRESQRVGDFKENIRSKFAGKLIMTMYNKMLYQIEDVNFDLSPKNTFNDKRANKDVSYIEFFQTRYGVAIRDQDQPLILAKPNNKRRREALEQENHDIYLIPEFCTLVGLTNEQSSDRRLKTDMIRAAQIDPNDRVKHILDFLDSLRQDNEVKEVLRYWGYSYSTAPVTLRARVLNPERICTGSQMGRDPRSWPPVDKNTADFERKVTSDSLAKAPTLNNWAILMPVSIPNDVKERISERIATGFERIKWRVSRPEKVQVRPDTMQGYIQTLKQAPDSAKFCIVVMDRQDKAKYDTIKKFAACERGLITQVVTARLLTDERKAGGASVKIAIQIAAKLGGEPWLLNFDVQDVMFCGYDINHKTADRGTSYGAFVATSNRSYSRYFSKASRHDRKGELSPHVAGSTAAALRRWKEVNGAWPKHVVIYRDGVSDGEIEQVLHAEVRQVKDAIRRVDPSIKLAFVVVNKRVGARFFIKGAGHQARYQNCPPGTVIDGTVTKPKRYDFYLISQSTRFGTLTPTYYEILEDNTGWNARKHQTIAHKMSLMYYNWTGAVRVPAPCQYAHKLAFLCGEHLQSTPSAVLDDYLHYL